ncbi:hypothetical protein TUMEXPCC7403_17310 [Tumidithrix helvetica PCC 7403]|uniref:DUF1816 domain-containing protein n=1 Tax=Tumidithrix helvetica TaxID=3457545 RepID=UPI003C865EE8
MSIPSLTFHPKTSNPKTELGWWIEIFSAQPPCLYFFGAFDSAEEAEALQDGFVQDLVHEGAQGIAVRLQWCQPTELTVTDPLDYSEFPPGVSLV